MVIVLCKLRSLRCKKESETKFVTGTPSRGRSSPSFHNGLHFGILFMEISKNLRVLGSIGWKLPKCVVQKHALFLDVAMVTEVGGGGSKIIFCFENLVIKIVRKLQVSSSRSRVTDWTVVTLGVSGRVKVVRTSSWSVGTVVGCNAQELTRVASWQSNRSRQLFLVEEVTSVRWYMIC